MSDATREAPNGAADTPLVEIRDLARSFETGSGRVDVLSGLGLGIREGDRIAIVGQSGVGKSTFLHILGTLDRVQIHRPRLPW